MPRGQDAPAESAPPASGVESTADDSQNPTNLVELLQDRVAADAVNSMPHCDGNALYNELMWLVASNIYDPAPLGDPALIGTRHECIETEAEAFELANKEVEAIGDRYTEVLNLEELQHYDDESIGTQVGIGIELKKIQSMTSTGPLEIAAVIEDGPAARAGIQAGDRIFKVNGVDVTQQNQVLTIRQIQGDREAGTPLSLTVERDGQLIDVELTRAEVNTNVVRGEMLEGNVGYIRIDNFLQGDTSEEFQAALEQLQTAGADSYIIDVRGNPGGSLDETLEIASLFVGDGTLTTLEQRVPPPFDGSRADAEYSTFTYSVDAENAVGEVILRGSEDVVVATFEKQQDVIDAPVVVLVDGDSASASEMLAGALRDNDAAILMGTTTFGKGVAQGIIPNRGADYGIKVTIARYYTPGGEWVGDGTNTLIGLTPDIEVLPPTDWQSEGDVQLHAATEYLNATTNIGT